MVYTEIIGDEVYIYINGKLTMKRWIKQKRSIVFNNSEIPYDKHTYTSITVDGVKHNNG